MYTITCYLGKLYLITFVLQVNEKIVIFWNYRSINYLGGLIMTSFRHLEQLLIIVSLFFLAETSYLPSQFVKNQRKFLDPQIA